VSAIRVLVVDDQSIVRAGLRMMIDAESDLHVVGEARTGAEAVTLAAALEPDVVLMDIRMPELDGIEATRRVVAANPSVAVVMITTFDDEQYLLESVRAGACGFLLKDAGPDLIATAIRAAHRGDPLVDPAMTRALLAHRMADPPVLADAAGEAARNAIAALSSRELEVLDGLARGLTNAEIARELFVSEATVKTHISSVLFKTGSRSRVQAAVLAHQAGVVADP
jgi:DNA-binding NarL/FixJ family response regulator